MLNHLSYDSFGNVVSQSNSSFNTRYGFTGRELDSEIGLYFYRGRYYDGKVGRFLSEDPIGFNGGDSNLYRYVGNSPLAHTDPLGLYGKVRNQTRIINYRIDNQTLSTTNPKEITEAAKQNPSSVSITFDQTQANIDFHPVLTGQETRKENRKNIPGMLGNDHQGHIVSRQLGGNSALKNFFAQNAWINSNSASPWYQYEQEVHRRLMDLNINNQCLPEQSLFYKVDLAYTQPNPPRLRPTSISAAAIFLPMGETFDITNIPNPE